MEGDEGLQASDTNSNLGSGRAKSHTLELADQGYGVSSYSLNDFQNANYKHHTQQVKHDNEIMFVGDNVIITLFRWVQDLSSTFKQYMLETFRMQLVSKAMTQDYKCVIDKLGMNSVKERYELDSNKYYAQDKWIDNYQEARVKVNKYNSLIDFNDDASSITMGGEEVSPFQKHDLHDHSLHFVSGITS